MHAISENPNDISHIHMYSCSYILMFKILFINTYANTCKRIQHITINSKQKIYCIENSNEIQL